MRFMRSQSVSKTICNPNSSRSPYRWMFQSDSHIERDISNRCNYHVENPSKFRKGGAVPEKIMIFIRDWLRPRRVRFNYFSGCSFDRSCDFDVKNTFAVEWLIRNGTGFRRSSSTVRFTLLRRFWTSRRIAVVVPLFLGNFRMMLSFMYPILLRIIHYPDNIFLLNCTSGKFHYPF